MRDPVWANTGTNKIKINKAATVLFMTSVYFAHCAPGLNSPPIPAFTRREDHAPSRWAIRISKKTAREASRHRDCTEPCRWLQISPVIAQICSCLLRTLCDLCVQAVSFMTSEHSPQRRRDRREDAETSWMPLSMASNSAGSASAVVAKLVGLTTWHWRLLASFLADLRSLMLVAAMGSSHIISVRCWEPRRWTSI